MARIQVDRTSRLEPPPTNLPYNAHPIYPLRKLLIIIAAIGALLCFVSWDPYDDPFFIACFFFLAVSAFFALSDLTAYALSKAQNPDKDPEWPRVIFMVGDVCLAVILQISFWAALASIESRGIYYGSRTLPAYAALTALLCSLIHAYSFKKEVMARYKKKWLASLTLEPCPRCGYHEGAHSAASEQAQQASQPNTFPYAGPSATYQRPTAMTPSSEEGTMEEGLLIGPEFGRNYGTAGSSEPTIGQPQEVVVSKGKKKRVVEGNDNPVKA